MMTKLKEFVAKCSRVLIVMRKPSRQEFKMIAQAAGLGILIIGAIGFLLAMLTKLVV